MTTWARRVNNQAVDVTSVDPLTIFHPAVAAEFVVIPDGTIAGALHAEGKWANPAARPPLTGRAPEVSPAVTAGQFYLLFNMAERIAIKASTDPIMQEFWATYQNALASGEKIDLHSADLGQAIAYLTVNPVGAPILAAGRDAQIKAGICPAASGI